MNNSGPHGFSEILYAYTSGTGNNGSAFAGITANTPWYNLTLGLAHADRPVPVPDSAAGRGRKPGREEEECQPPAAPSPPTARCSSACWSAPS